MSEPEAPDAEAAPSPGPLLAAGLAIGAAFATSLLFLAFVPAMDPVASRALALVLGTGTLGALAATYVPAPHAERVGLRKLPPGCALGLLLLVPAALLSSELDNWVRALAGAASPFATETAEADESVASGVQWLQLLVVMVGIEPVVEEWFFRGVLQQGSHQRLGERGAVLWSALLFAVYAALGRATTPADALAVVAQSTALGAVFGYARVTTGSLLAPIALHSAINGLALAGSTWFPIAGFTGPGAHTDPVLLLAAAASCALGVRLLQARRDSGSRDDPPPDGEVDAGETRERGSFGTDREPED